MDRLINILIMFGFLIFVFIIDWYSSVDMKLSYYVTGWIASGIVSDRKLKAPD
jgi:hypothetical protein